ncbi:glycosyltransferase family 25 protein [Sedimentitalea sp. JM2-8]|uniref:Glycosyltransferase family 25 protein n=1 Tax=Sedimentitalea xiamensis TaxID=3050037 RepID=A0ABT7FJK0_9RHOB|nr:glycosyltransferase family 25 protein [Sedimentitalea xiamensis]MDK3074954.1 glycosyltransferase family 25 protein [Sedimentitalea xiamensis]
MEGVKVVSEDDLPAQSGKTTVPAGTLFHPIVISLDDATERWEIVRDQFAEFGFEAERLPAVDGRVEGFQGEGYAPHSWRDRWELKPSEQAVFESHRNAWRRIVESGVAQGIVCEDDILVSPEFRKLPAALDTRRFGIVKLDGFSADRHYGAECAMNGWTVWEIVETVPSAACYALSLSAAERLLADSVTYCETLDDFVFRPRAGLQPVQLSSGVAVQRMCCEVPEKADGPASLRERQDRSRAKNGPLPYRAWKEWKRLQRRFWNRNTPKRRPTLAAGLPPYLN